MKFRVDLVDEAEADLVDIYRFIAAEEGVERAEDVLTRLETACRNLQRFPHRGRVPPELERIGVTHCREVISERWRIVYSVADEIVRVEAVLDGRRNLKTLLERRLLR